MKKYLTIFLIVLLSSNIKATQQIPDLLIIDKDTLQLFDLNNYPLESLNLKTRPFNYSYNDAPHTACWRGYQAIWRIIGNELYLEKIHRCYGDNKSDKNENLTELFSKNNLNVKKKNNMILANWVNLNLFKYEFYTTQPKKYRKKLFTDNWWKKIKPSKKDFKIVIKKGIVEINNL